MKKLFHEWFADCADVKTEEVRAGGQRVCLLFCEGLVDFSQIQQTILPHLDGDLRAVLNSQLPEKLLLKSLNREQEQTHVVQGVFDGNLVLYAEEAACYFLVHLAKHPQRSIEESNIETSIRGPREGLVEEVTVNVALIRKRMRTTDLVCENYVIGEELPCKVSLLYLKSRIEPQVLENVRKQLKSINVEMVASSQHLEDLLVGKAYTLMPLMSYTGRPDMCMASMLHGRFIVLLDGAPSALIGPTNLMFQLKSSEDANAGALYVSMEMMLRTFGLGLALFLPGLWIALITYHQDQIPYTLLATMVLSRQGVPLPAPLECVLMLSLFELFREAGLRLPISVGQTLSVVGGLIIGQAAISAGLTAPGILVVSAISVVATFTMVNQTLTGTVAIVRMVILLFSSMLGMFGFLIGMFLFLGYLAGLRSFGADYLTTMGKPPNVDWIKALFRVQPMKGVRTIEFFRRRGKR